LDAGKGWTTTHGFFAIMGGFMEYEGKRPVGVLLPNELHPYFLTGNGDFPRISKKDKSKGDVISKGVVILQTGWFVAQGIARAGQDLPITELELVTVAFAALSLVMPCTCCGGTSHRTYNVRCEYKGSEGLKSLSMMGMLRL